ncbi:MAG: hypothetical protein ACSLFM_02365, partial [Tepidiformaceae bacterium]
MRVRDEEDEDDWQEPPVEEDWEAPDLGPDERDRDLLDGSWEMKYYSGQVNRRDWSNVYLGIGILVVLSILL